MLLAKEQGGSVVAGYEWKNDGDAVEVPYDLAMELMAIKGGGFSVPEPGPPKAKPAAKPAVPAEVPAPADKPAPPK
jgi:hypothetical protein